MPLTKKEYKEIVKKLDEKKDFRFLSLEQIEEIEKTLKEYIIKTEDKCWGC